MDLKEKLLSNRFINPFSHPIPFCWEWQKSCNDKGYGQIIVENKNHKVHRISAHLWLGFDLNSDLEICHKCDNKKCFNPEHLFIGTHQENIQDAFIKGRLRNGKDGLFNTDKSKRVDIDDEEIKTIIDLKQSGISSKEIGQIYKISRAVVDKIIAGTWSRISTVREGRS